MRIAALVEVRRRQFLIATAVLFSAPLARAQKRLPVLGVLSPFSKPTPEEIQRSPFLVRLRELGWVEGKTLLFERAYGEGSEERLRELASTLGARNRPRIAEFAKRNLLPSAFTLPDYVEAGGLVSYGIDWRPTFAQTADYIDRILRGAKPGELPVDLPSRYVTAVNRKTAKALGLTVPPSILLRADRVIE